MKIRASHILVETKEQAENLLLDIENGVAFEDLAKEYSKCPSAFLTFQPAPLIVLLSLDGCNRDP